MRYGDRHDDCSLQVHLETDILLWLPEADAHTAVWRWNNWRHIRKLSFSLWLWAHCAGLETHHTSASLSVALAVMAAYPGVSPVLNCLFVLWGHSCWEQTTAENWAHSQRAPASFIWKARWDSLTRVPPKFPLSGPCHPLPGRCAPFAWPNRLTDSAVTTSTSTILRELWATRPLTHRVCSRGRIGGKWGGCRGQSDSLSCVWEGVWHVSEMNSELNRRWVILAVCRVVDAVFVMKLLKLQLTCMFTLKQWTFIMFNLAKQRTKKNKKWSNLFSLSAVFKEILCHRNTSSFLCLKPWGSCCRKWSFSISNHGEFAKLICALWANVDAALKAGGDISTSPWITMSVLSLSTACTACLTQPIT